MDQIFQNMAAKRVQEQAQRKLTPLVTDNLGKLVRSLPKKPRGVRELGEEYAQTFAALMKQFTKEQPDLSEIRPPAPLEDAQKVLSSGITTAVQPLQNGLQNFLLGTQRRRSKSRRSTRRRQRYTKRLSAKRSRKRSSKRQSKKNKA